MNINAEDEAAVRRAQAVLSGDAGAAAAIDVFVAARRGGCPSREAGRAAHLVMEAVNGQSSTGPDWGYDDLMRGLRDKVVEHLGEDYAAAVDVLYMARRAGCPKGAAREAAQLVGEAMGVDIHFDEGGG